MTLLLRLAHQIYLRCSLFLIIALAIAALAHAQPADDEFTEAPEDDVVLQEYPVPWRLPRESIDPGDETESSEPSSPSDVPFDTEMTDPAPLDAIAPAAPLPKIWSGNIELGITGTEGNQETFNIRAGGKATAKFSWSTQTYEAIYLDNTSSGVTTARSAIGDARWEIPLWTPKLAYYAHGRIENDAFKPYDLLLAGDTGLAYDWIKTDLNSFQTRSGLSTSREIGGVDDFWKPEWAFGLEWRRAIDARQKITLKSDYFPAWDDFSDYRLNTQADWEFAIQPTWNLSLKLSAISRYDATPNGAKPHDLNYAALVLWNY